MVHDSQRLALHEWEATGGHAPYHFKWVFHNSYTQVRSVVDETSNVVLGHLGQLLLEDTLQARQDDCAFPPAVIVDDSELNLAIALLDNSRLLWKGHYPFDWGRGGVVGLFRCRWAMLYALRGGVGRIGGRFALGWMGRGVSFLQVQRYIRRRVTCSESGYGECRRRGRGGIAQEVAQMRDVVAGRRHTRCATGVQGRGSVDEGDLEGEEAAHLLSSVAPAMMWC